MATSTENRIYRLSAVCAFLAALSFVMPRFVTNPEGGFAAGATAVMTLLFMLLATAIFSFYLLAITIRSYDEIALGPRVAGIAPGCILAIALVSLFIFLGY